MKPTSIRTITASIFLLSLTAFCGAPDRPVDFGANEHQCDHCRMGISNMRFKAEAITHKGKIYRFDAVECLSAWLQENREETASAWVTDFSGSEWIAYEKAFYLHSENLKSPMGAGLSAHTTEEKLKAAQKEHGGNMLNVQEMENYLKGR